MSDSASSVTCSDEGLTCSRNVVASRLVANGVDMLNILIADLDFLEVGVNAGWGDRLRNDAVTTNLGPSKAMDMLAAYCSGARRCDSLTESGQGWQIGLLQSS